MTGAVWLTGIVCVTESLGDLPMAKFIFKRLVNYVVMLFLAISFTYVLASIFMNP